MEMRSINLCRADGLDSLQTWYLQSYPSENGNGSMQQSPLGDTVELLTECRLDELSRLEGLKGSRKLLAVYR